VEGASDPTGKRTVSLMFPGNARTVVQLMDAWQEAKVIWGTSQVGQAHTASSAGWPGCVYTNFTLQHRWCSTCKGDNLAGMHVPQPMHLSAYLPTSSLHICQLAI
jgi:hypothetical protein